MKRHWLRLKFGFPVAHVLSVSLHASKRAVFVLLGTPFSLVPGVHTSVNAARTSACATRPH